MAAILFLIGWFAYKVIEVSVETKNSETNQLKRDQSDKETEEAQYEAEEQKQEENYTKYHDDGTFGMGYVKTNRQKLHPNF